MLCWSSCVDSICFFFWRCIVVPVYLWFLFLVQMVQDCVWCTHVECIWSKWPTSHLPTYQHLTFRFVSDTRSWCCLVLQDTVMWPHMCVHLYTCDCNSVNVFWVRIHSRFRSEYKIAPIACQINYSKVWKYKVTNSYFGLKTVLTLSSYWFRASFSVQVGENIVQSCKFQTWVDQVFGLIKYGLQGKFQQNGQSQQIANGANMHYLQIYAQSNIWAQRKNR